MAARKQAKKRTKRANREGSIYYRSSRDRYEGRVTVDYKTTGTDESGAQIRVPVRRTFIGATRDEVAQRIFDARRALDEQGALPDRRSQLGTYLNHWLRDVLPHTGVSSSTIENYRNIVEHYIAPTIGSTKLGDVRPDHVRQMLRGLERKGYSANTRRLARSTLRRALTIAEREGVIGRNPVALTDGVRLDSTEGRALDVDQVRALLEHVRGDRLEAHIVTLVTTGLRMGELLGLRWTDLALDRKQPTLTVQRTLRRLATGLELTETKTKGSRRTVHLPAVTVAALRAQRLHLREERLRIGELWHTPFGDLVFPSRDGGAYDPRSFRRDVYNVTEAALGDRWSPHTLRHTAASLLLSEGVPLKNVADMLGHASVRMTSDVYGHISPHAQRVTADVMGELLG